VVLASILSVDTVTGQGRTARGALDVPHLNGPKARREGDRTHGRTFHGNRSGLCKGASCGADPIGRGAGSAHSEPDSPAAVSADLRPYAFRKALSRSGVVR